MKQIVLIGLVILVSVLTLAGVMWVQSDKYLRQQAVQECMTIATKTEVLSEWVTEVRPIEEVYDMCMEEKGY